MEYICSMVKKYNKQVEELLDNIYKDILNSSDESKEIDCEFYVKNMNWDKILKYAYIDMIPLNLFVEDGKPVYIGIEDLKKKYRIIDVWDKFINIENKFVEKNRDYNNNKYFMELSIFDKKLIDKNINKLMK